MAFARKEKTMPRKASTVTEDAEKTGESTQENVDFMPEESVPENIPEPETQAPSGVEAAEDADEDIEAEAAEDPDADVDDGTDVDEDYDVKIIEDSSTDPPITPRHTASEPAPRVRQRNLARMEERERQQAQAEAQIANESALISAIHTQRIFTDKVAALETIPMLPRSCCLGNRSR